MGKTFFSDNGFRIIFVVVFLLAFVWMGTKRTLLSNANNVADWLPDSFAETKEYQWFLKYFPFESFVVVSWEGCTMDDDRLEMFAEKLVPGQTIDNMAEWMSGAGKLTADLDLSQTPEKIPPDLEKTASNEPVGTETEVAVVPTPKKAEPQFFKNVLTGPRLKRLLEERYGTDPSSPTYLTEEQIMNRLDGLLIGPQRTASDGTPLPIDKYRTAMIVTLNKQPNEKALRKVLAKIRAIGRECGVEPEPEVDNRPIVTRVAGNVKAALNDMIFGLPPQVKGIVMGGPPVDNVAIGVEGERTLYRLAGICALVGLTIAMFCFRSLRLTMFVFWVAILSAGISLACVSLTGSNCDAIMLSMPALIYVLAMSGAIHIINYYHDAVREDGVSGAAERAITLGWYPCFMAAFTTAIGLGSLYFSHLIPIMKFGFYSAIGVMATLLLLFFYLPSLLHFYPSRELAEKAAEKGAHFDDNSLILRFWRFVGKKVIKYNPLVACACMGIMIYFAMGVFDIKTSVKMMRFYSPNAEIIAHYTALEETIGPLVPMEIVIKFDNTRCRFNTLERLRFIQEISDKLLRELPDDIGGVMSAATMTPSTEPRGNRGSNRSRAIEYALNGRLEKSRSLLKDYIRVEGNPSLKATDPDYIVNLQQLGLAEADAVRLREIGIYSLDEILSVPEGESRHGISADDMKVYREKALAWEKAYGTDLWRISMRVWALKKDIDYAHFIDDVKNVVNPMVDEFLKAKFPKEVFPPHETLVPKPKATPLEMTTGWFSAKAEMFSEMIWPKAVEKKADPSPVSAVYTGMVPVVYKTQHELIAGLVDSLASAFLLIALTMAFILKSPTAGFFAMLPNVFPVLVVFGFMGRMGILVDVGTMMTASVAMGIAVDNTIHYLTWFRVAIDQGFKPRDAALEAYQRCATAMSETTLIGGIGLAAFAFSTFTPTQMFGVMMLAMLSVSLFGDLIFLPSILTGPAGRFFLPKSCSPLDPPRDVVPDLNPNEAIKQPLKIIDETSERKHVG